MNRNKILSLCALAVIILIIVIIFLSPYIKKAIPFSNLVKQLEYVEDKQTNDEAMNVVIKVYDHHGLFNTDIQLYDNGDYYLIGTMKQEHGDGESTSYYVCRDNINYLMIEDKFSEFSVCNPEIEDDVFGIFRYINLEAMEANYFDYEKVDEVRVFTLKHDYFDEVIVENDYEIEDVQFKVYSDNAFELLLYTVEDDEHVVISTSYDFDKFLEMPEF